MPLLLFAGVIASWVVVFALLSNRLAPALDTGFERVRASHELLATMFDQERHVRAYLGSGHDPLLQPYHDARRRFDDLLADELARTASPQLRERLERQRTLALAWRRLAIADVRAFETDDRAYRRALRERERRFAAFRRENARYETALRRHHLRAIDTQLLRMVVLVIAVGAVIGAAALVVATRRGARARRHAAAQAEFAIALQTATDSAEASDLLKRHLERQIGGATVTVLRRDESGERLEAGTAVVSGAALERALADARPRDCLAIRRGSAQRVDGDDVLVPCAICGAGGAALCTPLLVGEQVLGAVLVEQTPDEGGARWRGRRRVRLPDPDSRVMRDSLAQAAPVLSGLRTLALAQSRATTDPLTDLPNRWAFEDALDRMCAQARRARRPLALVLLDLDHFKQVNDRHGHDTGDEVLGAVGRALAGAVRDGDLAARSGGEEFAVLLPDTPLERALDVAERLRAAIAEIDLPLPGFSPSASLGVAVLPLHARDAGRLVRAADQALYAAKRAGRDRVEVAEPNAAPAPIRIV